MIHAGKCKWKNEFEVEKIINHRGPITSRSFLIKWRGYPVKEATWEPRAPLMVRCSQMVREYDASCDAAGPAPAPDAEPPVSAPATAAPAPAPRERSCNACYGGVRCV